MSLGQFKVGAVTSCWLHATDAIHVHIFEIIEFMWRFTIELLNRMSNIAFDLFTYKLFQ